jgi:hypothetical protein
MIRFRKPADIAAALVYGNRLRGGGRFDNRVGSRLQAALNATA